MPIEGAGLKDYFKIIRNIKEKLLKTATNVKDRTIGFVTGKRDDYPPDVRNILSEYGNNNITNIVVKRDPLQKAVETSINLLSLGQFSKSKQQAGYDTYFHLYLIATLDNGINLRIEKNEVISITIYNNSQQGEKFNVKMNNPIMLNSFLDNARIGMGDKDFFYYDALYSNCQVFLNSLMKFNGLLQINTGLEAFIMQDYTTLIKNLSSTTKQIMKGTTDIARRFNILLKGKGLKFKKNRLN